MKDNRSLYMLIGSMVIFGTIGVVRRYIPLPSAAIAAMRGLAGAAFLLALNVLRRKKLDRAAIRADLWRLILSGTVIGANWIALFEAYRFTTVAVATLCYYMAPVFVIALSPLVLKERLTARKGLCAALAVAGMVLVSGVLDAGGGSPKGVLLGLLAAALYASVILINKRMRPMPAMDRTVVQLAAAGAVVLPYALLTGGGGEALTPLTVGLLAVICIVHTGLAYALYFGSMEGLPAHTIALLSYIDPVVAVVLSALVLREPLTLWTVLGAVGILGAAILGELPEKQ